MPRSRCGPSHRPRSQLHGRARPIASPDRPGIHARRRVSADRRPGHPVESLLQAVNNVSDRSPTGSQSREASSTVRIPGGASPCPVSRPELLDPSPLDWSSVGRGLSGRVRPGVGAQAADRAAGPRGRRGSSPIDRGPAGRQERNGPGPRRQVLPETRGPQVARSDPRALGSPIDDRGRGLRDDASIPLHKP